MAQRIISLSVTPAEEDQEFVYNAITYAAVQVGRDCPNSNVMFSAHSYDEDEIVDPIEDVYYDEDTLAKVREALRSVGMSHLMADDAVLALQNAGILFRERKR